MQEIEKLVPDTSIIIEGIVSQKIEEKDIKVNEVLIHEAVIAELEHQANTNRTIGFLGLEEIKKLRELSVKHDFQIKFLGLRPKAAEIKHASIGEIDSMIRELAYAEDGTLITADKVQAKVGEAKGIHVIYIRAEQADKKLKLEKYFDDATMSVHLKENTLPVAKKGKPGEWDFVELSKIKLKQEDVQEISREIIEVASATRDGFVEIDRPGSTIVQLGRYRIVIARPPFADGWEITAVRPVKKLNLEDYKLSDKLKQRLETHAEGMLVAGSPGMGKSTFAQALAEFYANKKKIVKTVEAPRDLILPDEITQYAISHGSSQEIHDILLLSRPDYTVFDEMRNTDDFALFADMRLAGVGMIGVVHATNPIDAIQRFIGRIEMGVIPQIIDTVVFIKNGQVNAILELEMTVKVPSGMTEADLARPVVVVNDFETGQLRYEIYSYGEQTVVIPVTKHQKKSSVQKLASESVERFFKRIVENVKVEVVSDNKCVVYVPEEYIARIIGKQGKTINELEDKLGLSIDVKELAEYNKSDKNSNEKGNNLQYEVNITKKAIVFYLTGEMIDKDVDIYVGDDFLLTAKVSKKATININKDNKLGKLIVDEINSGGKVKLMV